jgi:hypothetical protein
MRENNQLRVVTFRVKKMEFGWRIPKEKKDGLNVAIAFFSHIKVHLDLKLLHEKEKTIFKEIRRRHNIDDLKNDPKI